MRLKLAICDDEQEHLKKMASAVRGWGQEHGYALEVSTFASAEAFLFAYEEDHTYEILLLDVEMRGMSGVDLAKRLRKEGNRVEIIFTTSHFEFYGEGYEVDALHYLIKPIDDSKLKAVLDKAVERILVEPPSLIISCNGEMVKLPESDIWYVEALLHYTVIHTGEKEYKVKENFSVFAKKLSEDFFQTHRSYLVSLKHIKRISRGLVTLENGMELPLSRGKYDAVNRAYIERN